MILIKRVIVALIGRTRKMLVLPKLVIGFLIYLVTNKTSPAAYQSMITMFCVTSGRSNDWLSRLIGVFKPSYSFSDAIGVLGDMVNEERERVVSVLRERGYYVFENRLPDELCDRLIQYATTHECKIRPMDGEGQGRSVTTIYHRGKPQAIRYDFDTQDLLNNPDVQNLLADLSFAAVAQDYLGARPVLDVLSMWWHTDFSDKPDMEAAQYYHFDMDRPKWLKYFIYLTDVDTTNGPHTFVAGSNRSGGIPANLLKKGYARLTDEEVEACYDKKDIIEFVAPRGTIIAEDTRGLHKGRHVVNGDRLMLQIQFSNSMFGGFYPKARLGEKMTEELIIKTRRYPKLYATYINAKS